MKRKQSLENATVKKVWKIDLNYLKFGELLLEFLQKLFIIMVGEILLQTLMKVTQVLKNDCFHILDHASTTFQFRIKEAFHIQREQPSLNQQLHHVNLKLSF